MGLSDFVLWACLVSACLLVGFGLVRLSSALYLRRLARIDAEYRAAALVINTRRQLRAGQHRAREREWGRAA